VSLTVVDPSPLEIRLVTAFLRSKGWTPADAMEPQVLWQLHSPGGWRAVDLRDPDVLWSLFKEHCPRIEALLMLERLP
jgi:hypothetical protein